MASNANAGIFPLNRLKMVEESNFRMAIVR